MLRALARAAGLPGLPALQQEGAAALQRAAPALCGANPGWQRAYSAADGSSSSGSAEAEAPGSHAPAARPQTKEWRSWIDTKLDSKLEAAEPQPAAAPAAAARPPQPPATKRAKGFELEQQIYSIVVPQRAAGDEQGAMPEGITSYAQLAMATDAPRFLRGAANIADISPQRLHPTRLFFPQQTYAPGDLDPYRTSAAALAGDLSPQTLPLASPMEVARLADYKNAPLLGSFLSDAGKLPLRRTTHLRAKLHRRLARQIKVARQLAILSPTERYVPPSLAAAAERYSKQSPQRQRSARQGRRQQQQQQQ